MLSYTKEIHYMVQDIQYASAYHHVGDLTQTGGQRSHHCQSQTSEQGGQSCPQRPAGPHTLPSEW